MLTPAVSLDQVRALERILARSDVVQAVLSIWEGIQLPDCWLVAGSIAQTVWNHGHGFSMGYGLRDIDIVYFDPSDLSVGTEEANEHRIARLLDGVPAKVDVKNEARVHLWYGERFGYPLTPYTSTEAAIATFPATATSIGVQPKMHGLAVTAPLGMDDLLNLIVRPNKVQIERPTYEEKIKRWKPLWPKLTIIDW